MLKKRQKQADDEWSEPLTIEGTEPGTSLAADQKN